MKNRNKKKILNRSVAVLASLFLAFCFIQNIEAATGINKQVNFQGKVVNTNGTNVTNGSYTFLFCIYTTASPATPCTAGADNDALWRESKNLTVTDGIFQTNLGDTTAFASLIDFNTDNIYLGINFNADGQMTPLVRFTAAPYAMNAAKVGGLTVTDTTGTLTIPNGETISFAESFATSGAFATTLTATGTTNVTLPTTGTLATLAGTEILTNKTIGSTGLVFSGATTDITTASGEDLTIVANGAGVISLSDATTILGTALINSTGTAATTIGNATGTFQLTSNGGLNVSTGGALTGVASIDTIAVSATAITFAGTGTVASTTTGLTLDSGSNTLTIASSDTTLTASGIATMTLAANASITNATGNITFQPAGSGTTATVQIGAGGAGSTTPDYFGLDVKSDTSETGGFEGAMYYNTFDNKFRCYQGAAWTDCITSGGTTDLQTAYGNDADGSNTTISLTAADDGLIITNPTSSGNNLSAFTLQVSQLNTTAAISAIDIIQASNAANGVDITANSIDTETGLSITANALTSGKALTLASSATAFTGALQNITLSGSNGMNTGTLLAIDNTGVLNDNTSLYVKHYATGISSRAFRIDDESGDTTPFVVDGGGNVGIGYATPGAQLDILGSNSTATVGSEMITSATDRDFTGSIGNWTAGSNWAYGTNNAIHTAGTTGTLSLANGNLSAAPVADHVYRVAFRVNTTTAGTLTMSFGSVNGVVVGQDAALGVDNQVQVIRATGTGALTFTPSSAWAGTIDNVSIMEITESSPTQIVRNSDGSKGLEIRAGGIGLSSTFVGVGAGSTNTTQSGNSFFGYQSGYANVTGNFSSFFGYQAGLANTIGTDNVFLGSTAGAKNTTGSSNTFAGSGSGANNVVGYQNAFFGYNSGSSNSTGALNTYIGDQSGQYNSTGNYNVALGEFSGGYNNGGSSNAIIGYNAGRGSNGASNYSNNTVLGYQSGYALTTGSNNILLGYKAGDAISSGANNIVLGYDIDAPSPTGSNQLTIGNLIFGSGLTSTGTTISTGSVGIGDATPDYTLELSGATAPKFASSDTEVAHGITAFAQTDTYFMIDEITNDDGGARVWGLSDAVGQNPLKFIGAFGSTDPTDTVAGVIIQAGKRSGTSIADLGALETVLEVGLANSGNKLLTILGSGYVGIGTTTPDTQLHIEGTANQILTVESTGAGNHAILRLSAGSGGRAFIDSATSSSSLYIVQGGGYVAQFDTTNMGVSIGSGSGYAQTAESAPTNGLIVQGNVGIGDTTPDAPLEITSTSTQFRISYTDGSVDGTIGVDSSENLLLQAGTSAETKVVQIGVGGAGSTTPDYFGLDVKSDTSETGGFEGAMYYNTFDNKFRCYQGAAWTDCITSGGTTDLQTAYGNDADGSNTTISLTAADDGLIITNPTSSGNNLSAFTLQVSQLNTTAAISAIDIIQASNAANGVDITANAIDTETGLSITANALTSGKALSIAHTTSVIASGGSLLNLSSTSADTATTSGTLLNLAGNSTAAGTLARISGTGLTTGNGLVIVGGTAMTTGSDLDVNGATYVHGTETGSLAKFTFTDATIAAVTSTTNGILISPTINAPSGAATRTINGISVEPTFTACSAGTCAVNGVNIGNVTDGTGFTGTGLKVGTGWDTVMSGTTAGTSLFDFTNFDVTSAGALDVGSTITAGSSNIAVTDSTGHVQHDSIVDCADGQILKWATGGGEWGCATDATGGPTTKYLNTQHNISSTTATEVTGISTTLAAGTYVFKYSLIVQAAATGTGISFGINYTGTVTKMVALEYFQDSLTAASGGTIDDANTGLASEQIVAGSAARTETTTAPNMNVIQGFTTANVNNYVTIEGVIVVSDGGDIELWHASESAAQTSVMTGSTLTITEITQGADFAEIYGTKDASIVPGDVVALDPSMRAGVKKSERSYDENVFGIVSTSPGAVTGSLIDTDAMPVIVALSGRVPVKVTTENGPIKSGDLLTASSIPGVAMRATKAGQVVGQAMGAYTGEGIGSVLAFIKTDYSNGARLADILSGFTVGGTEISPADIGKQALAEFISQKEQLASSVDVSEIMTDRVSAGLEIITPKVTTQELAVDVIKPSLTNTLAIQVGPDGLITFGEAGKAPTSTIDALGNATFSGVVTAKTIRADSIEGLEIYTDSVKSLQEKYAGLVGSGIVAETIPSETVPPVQAVAEASLSQTLEALTTDTLIVNLDGSILGALSVNGALTIAGPAEFQDETIFQKLATFFGDTIFSGKVAFEQTPSFSADTAGFALIERGAQKVRITFDVPYENQPIVTASISNDQSPLLDGNEDNALKADITAVEKEYRDSVFGSDVRFLITEKDETGFTIVLSKQAPRDIQFSWVALSVGQSKTFISEKAVEGPSSYQASSIVEEPIVPVVEVAPVTTIPTAEIPSDEGVVPVVVSGDVPIMSTGQ